MSYELSAARYLQQSSSQEHNISTVEAAQRGAAFCAVDFRTGIPPAEHCARIAVDDVLDRLGEYVAGVDPVGFGRPRVMACKGKK